MTFGTATLGLRPAAMPQREDCAPPEIPTAPPAAAPPAGGRRYDCGRHGQLTVDQIAILAGTTRTAIYYRIRKGATGEPLCERRWARQSQIRKAAPPQSHMLVCAFRIAHQFPDRLPTVAEIRRLRPMSIGNAQAWRQAIQTARLQAGMPT